MLEKLACEFWKSIPNKSEFVAVHGEGYTVEQYEACIQLKVEIYNRIYRSAELYLLSLN